MNEQDSTLDKVASALSEEEEDQQENEGEESKKVGGDAMSDFTLVDSIDLEVQSSPGKAVSSASFVSIHKSELESSEYTIVGGASEHLSHIDPSDEFLSVDGHSVVDEVIQQQRGGGHSISSYSFVEDESIDAESLGAGGVIKTHRDLYAEDQMIERFVHYISLVSEDVQKMMDKHRSKEALIHAAAAESK